MAIIENPPSPDTAFRCISQSRTARLPMVSADLVSRPRSLRRVELVGEIRSLICPRRQVIRIFTFLSKSDIGSCRLVL